MNCSVLNHLLALVFWYVFNLTSLTLTTRQFPTKRYYDNNFIVIHKNYSQCIMPNTQSSTDNDIALNNEITADNTVNDICIDK